MVMEISNLILDLIIKENSKTICQKVYYLIFILIVVANIFVFKDLKEEPIEENKVTDPKCKLNTFNNKRKNSYWGFNNTGNRI